MNAGFPQIKPRGATIFSPEQEAYLGDAVAEQMQRRLLIYDRPDLTAPLDRIAARLLTYLPAEGYRFRFSLIELDDANAFALPGGRVYVSRRLISFVRDEDELAGTLAHEMGHVLARQASVDITKLFNDLLRVTQVTDRDDIFRKFNQMIDNAARKPGGAKREADDQQVADRVSMGAVWRAGYDPEALPRFYDRLTGNKGATGGFFSDFFGLTRPESRRFREMLKEIEGTPTACRQPRSKETENVFREWQKKVRELSPEDRVLTGSDRREPFRRLAPTLRPELINIKFSPDGKLLLAQDESGINVLRREPLQLMFRIPALAGHPAIFNRTSNGIIFQTAGSRLETWSLKTSGRERIWESETQRCQEILPSPDGVTIACFGGTFGNEVRLIDMDSDMEIGKHTYNPTLEGLLSLLLIGPAHKLVHGAFAPDGSAFLMSPVKGGACCDAWAFNPDKRAEISVPRALKNAMSGYFAFVSSGRIATVHPRDPKESGVFAWPEGTLLDKFLIPDVPLEPITEGAEVLLHPIGDFGMALISLEDRELFQSTPNPAFDRYDGVGAGERITGEIGLYAGRKPQAVAVLQLPEAELGRLRSAAHSADLEWLTLSVQTRAQLWNLKTGQSQALAPFEGAFVSDDGIWSANFEQRRNVPGKGTMKVMVRTSIDLGQRKQISEGELPENTPSRRRQYLGKYEVSTVTGRGKPILSVFDTSRDRTLWTRELEDLPRRYLGNALVLHYQAGDKTAQQMIKESPELKWRMESIPKRSDASILEVLALDTGKSLGRVVLDSANGSVEIRGVRVAGKTLFIEDNNNRTLSYSLEAGDRIGQQFGRVLAVDPVQGRAAMQNQPGRVLVFNSSLKQLAEFIYPGNVIYAGFDGAGQRLLAVTGAQEVFIETLPVN